MSKLILAVTAILFLAIAVLLPADAQEKGKAGGIPPALVVTADVEAGKFSPEAEFVGTLFYKEVSDVASEVDGMVEAYFFEEGERVKDGHVLVRLSTDLIEKDVKAKKAQYEEFMVSIEKARKDLIRMEKLFEQGSISEQDHDEHYFRLKGLEKRLESLDAEMERLNIVLQKKTITAPFYAVVLKRYVDRGEWLSPGSRVGALARYDAVDVVVDLPEEFTGYIRQGRLVHVKAGGKSISGIIKGIIPKGDISTRTFPVKIEVKNPGFLKEGMEARVLMPIGEKRKALLINRDAVIKPFGKNVVFSVADSKAKMIAVDVIGFDGLKAVVRSEELKEGMKVIVKGHERLRDGQEIKVQ